VSLRLVVLGFGARRRSNLCFRGVDFFVGSPFYPSCFISSAVDFLVFFCLWCRMSVESVCVGGEGERESARGQSAGVWEVVCWRLVWIFTKIAVLWKQTRGSDEKSVRFIPL